MDVHDRQSEDLTAEVLSDDTGAKECPGLMDLPIVVLRKILNYLSASDLLHNVSLVNKTCQFEARCVLRDFKTCTADLKSGGLPCERFREFEVSLSHMTVNPYNGLNAAGPEAYGHFCVCEGHPATLWPHLYGMTWKTVGVNGRRFFESNERPCPALQLMSDIMLHKSTLIASLKVFTDETLTIPEVAPHGPTEKRVLFPMLKSLNLTGSATQPHPYDLERIKRKWRPLMANLLANAPNLKYLEYLVNAQDLESFPPETIAKVSEFVLVPLTRRDQQYREALEQLPALNFIRARSEDVNPVAHGVLEFRYNEPEGAGAGWEEWASVLPVLQNNYEHLERLETDYVVAAVLMTSGLTPFQRVKDLSFHVSPTAFRIPHYQRLIRLFVCKYFPKLESLTLTVQPLYFGYDVRAVYDWLGSDQVLPFINRQERDDSMSTCKTVSEYNLRLSLDRYTGWFSEQSFTLIAESSFFSSIKSFKIYEVLRWSERTGIDNVWSLPWSHLEMIEILVDSEHLWDFDAAFCGISVDEVQMLRQLPLASLRDYQFAPIRHSITNLGFLKNLRIVLKLQRSRLEETLPAFQVAACLALQRMSQLQVTIVASLDDIEQRLNHLVEFECIQLLNVDDPQDLMPRLKPLREPVGHI